MVEADVWHPSQKDYYSSVTQIKTYLITRKQLDMLPTAK